MIIREKKNRKRNESKLEKRVKLSLFTDVMMLCKVNSKDATRKLLEFINELAKVVG